jgi:hypothetical protein
MNKDKKVIKDIAKRIYAAMNTTREITLEESAIAGILSDAGHTPNLIDRMQPENEIALVWHITDVQDQAERRGGTLTDDEAREILETAAKKHDASEGITWDILDCHIHDFVADRRHKTGWYTKNDFISADMRKQIEDNRYLNMLPEEHQKLACQIWNIVTTAIGDGPCTGGCRPFYSPEEWKERGEAFGNNAELIICHDGGDFARVFNISYENYELQESVREMLAKIGYYTEQCTSWCTAVYKLR